VIPDRVRDRDIDLALGALADNELIVGVSDDGVADWQPNAVAAS
jgi:hypothetical protein